MTLLLCCLMLSGSLRIPHATPLAEPFAYSQQSRVGMWGMSVLRPRAQSNCQWRGSMARCDRADGAFLDLRNKADFEKV